uniref:non-specific serine/threonine protein kinase n=1 Tax=Chromera velia CCMP2878 TaxID=1169474 RepID=A0A0G4IDV7_9ALVE|eukprot:Cvel_13544.t1-p1 / transcript=Cvel_13544.t1 / gene=Cvel_13544 / organism=Chromera_velia_CCMP2878 / gene_product=Inhibitor of nuclear factor kappa-B kinase subunit, putative / transcript_product=Inhibitor of nuclear factor kappa-B kinase subunit, putative / location=Cvel_scaffold930:14559-18968(+) / protein_length=338 / sequence_SO=supercontig / SO=protein_coding / is_pseudo=false
MLDSYLKDGSYSRIVDAGWLFRDVVILIMPKYDGDLLDLLDELGRGMTEDEALGILKQILTGLQGLHEHPDVIVHRDLKPSNILYEKINGETKVRIGDLGFARKMRGAQNLSWGGTYEYMASLPLRLRTVMTKMLDFRPRQRGTPREILSMAAFHGISLPKCFYDNTDNLGAKMGTLKLSIQDQETELETILTPRSAVSSFSAASSSSSNARPAVRLGGSSAPLRSLAAAAPAAAAAAGGPVRLDLVALPQQMETYGARVFKDIRKEILETVQCGETEGIQWGDCLDDNLEDGHRKQAKQTPTPKAVQPRQPSEPWWRWLFCQEDCFNFFQAVEADCQ